jgi:hypothetical protein
MLVRFVSGPNAGQTRHVERNQTTQLLIDSGFVEVVQPAQQPEQAGAPTFKKPAAPEWKIGRLPHEGTAFLQLTTPVIGEVVRHTGSPDEATAFFERHYKQCGPIPAATLEAYRAERERPGSTRPTRTQQHEADAARMQELMKGREETKSIYGQHEG